MGWLQETKDGVTPTVKAVPRVPGSCGSASFSDFIATDKTHSESIDEMLEFLSVFDARVIRFDVDAHIDRAILLPSNTTVYVDNCTIWQNDDVFDNVFRSANVRDLPSDDYAEMIAAHDKTPGTGVQVDLLLQTRRSLCLVEVKRKREIGRDVIEEMQEKVQRVPRRDGMSVKTALVYEGHLAPIVEADGYFDAIVPFRNLLGL